MINNFLSSNRFPTLSAQPVTETGNAMKSKKSVDKVPKTAIARLSWTRTRRTTLHCQNAGWTRELQHQQHCKVSLGLDRS